MKEHKVIIDTGKCVGCGMCEKVCVASNIALKNKMAETLFNDCITCGQCSAVCPRGAITITGYATEQVEKTKEVRLDPQEMLDLIRFRRSIRQFQNKEVPKEIIYQILEAGRLTHTAKNMQDVSFVVLDKEKDSFEKMAVSIFRRLKPFADLFSPMARRSEIGEHFFFFEAPIVIVVFAKEKVNGILASQNMEFVAEANGLGVLFSGYFTIAANASHKIRKAMKAPKGKRAAMTLVLGYPKVKFLRSAQRKELDVSYL